MKPFVLSRKAMLEVLGASLLPADVLFAPVSLAQAGDLRLEIAQARQRGDYARAVTLTHVLIDEDASSDGDGKETNQGLLLPTFDDNMKLGRIAAAVAALRYVGDGADAALVLSDHLIPADFRRAASYYLSFGDARGPQPNAPSMNAEALKLAASNPISADRRFAQLREMFKNTEDGGFGYYQGDLLLSSAWVRFAVHSQIEGALRFCWPRFVSRSLSQVAG